MIREEAKKAITHAFNLQDLWPVEQKMIDIVIDATLGAVIVQLEDDGCSSGASLVGDYRVDAYKEMKK